MDRALNWDMAGYSGHSFRLVHLLYTHPGTLQHPSAGEAALSGPKQEPLGARPPPSSLAGQQPGPRRMVWRRTSRTCQTMELDEGPPDHARSTWERRNVMGGALHLQHELAYLPTLTRVHPQSPGAGQQVGLVGCSWDRPSAGRVAGAENQGPEV